MKTIFNKSSHFYKHKTPFSFAAKTASNLEANTNLLYSIGLFTFATKMRGTVTKNKKDSAGRRLGPRKYGGAEVYSGDILVRQRGLKWKPGENVHYGKDHTLHASKEGKMVLTYDPYINYKSVRAHVVEEEIPNRVVKPPMPFMYHPELYPELAKNNISCKPLKTEFNLKKPNISVKESTKFTTVKNNQEYTDKFRSIVNDVLADRKEQVYNKNDNYINDKINAVTNENNLRFSNFKTYENSVLPKYLYAGEKSEQIKTPDAEKNDASNKIDIVDFEISNLPNSNSQTNLPDELLNSSLFYKSSLIEKSLFSDNTANDSNNIYLRYEKKLDLINTLKIRQLVKFVNNEKASLTLTKLSFKDQFYLLKKCKSVLKLLISSIKSDELLLKLFEGVENLEQNPATLYFIIRYGYNLNNFNKFKGAVSFEIENLSAFMRKLSQIVSYKNRLKLTKLRKIYQIKSKYQMIKQNKSSFKRRGVKLIKSLNQMKERNIASRNASIELSKKVNDMIIENNSAPNLNEAKKLLQQRKVKEAFLLVTKSIKEHNEKLLESKSKSKRKEKVKTEVSIDDSKNTGNTINLEQEINQKAQIQKKH